jgi:copper transport protein
MSAIRRVAVTVLLVLGVMVAAAPAASAHAVLLRTDPSPQSTVPRAPERVRLEFSEAVETAFGAVRVFDVDGHRVDRGQVRRAPGRRVLDVPVQSLPDGTYTVTWRVVSADGHQVHGGFVFYMGAPSSISPVAIGEDAGAGRAVGWGFGVARFIWFIAFLGLVGVVIGRRFVWTPALRAAGLADGHVAAAVRRRVAVVLPAAWAVLVIAGAVSLVFQAASVSGLGFFSAAHGNVLGEVLDTSYGRAWTAQLVLVGLAFVPVLALARPGRPLGGRPTIWIAALLALLTGTAVATAFEGHARTDPHPALSIVSIAVHLVAVGTWVGGLAALVLLAGRGWRAVPGENRATFVRHLVPRFSRVAVVAVLVVVVTGTFNTIANLAGFDDLWRTAYGRLVTAKVALLLVALALAARHLRSTPRRLEGDTGEREVRTFGRTAALELAVLVAAVALAAGLIAAVPGRSLALAAKGPVSQEHRAGSHTVQLFVDPSEIGANQIHLTFITDQGLAAAEVSNATVTLDGRRLAARLIAPGHFVADTALPTPGPYRLSVATPVGSTTFTFKLQRRT